MEGACVMKAKCAKDRNGLTDLIEIFLFCFFSIFVLVSSSSSSSLSSFSSSFFFNKISLYSPDWPVIDSVV